MKMYGIGLRTPPVGARIGLKKIPFLVHALGFD
jgi:hypothetical protein